MLHWPGHPVPTAQSWEDLGSGPAGLGRAGAQGEGPSGLAEQRLGWGEGVKGALSPAGWPLGAGVAPKGHEERLQAGPGGRRAPAPGSGAPGGRLVLENRAGQVSSWGAREREEGGRRKRPTACLLPPAVLTPAPRRLGEASRSPGHTARQQRREGGALPGEGVRRGHGWMATPGTLHGPSLTPATLSPAWGDSGSPHFILVPTPTGGTTTLGLPWGARSGAAGAPF